MVRFSSFVRVTSLHIRASSVLRLVVYSGERTFKDGKVVLVTNAGDDGESIGEALPGQDIDVDLRGVFRYASRGSYLDKMQL